MRLLIAFFSILVSALSASGQCTSHGSRINVSHTDSLPPYTNYEVEIEVIVDYSAGCPLFASGLTYQIYTSCGFHITRTVYPDTVVERDSSDILCYSAKEYAKGQVRNYRFHDQFSMDTVSSCASVLVYYPGTPVKYDNIDSTSGGADLSWVLINPIFLKEELNFNNDYRVLESCVGEKRYFRPATKRNHFDSLHMEVKPLLKYDTTGTPFLSRVGLGFDFPFNDKMPLPAYDLKMADSRVGFTAFDTGFYALPVTIEEWNIGTPTFPLFAIGATSHYTTPVYINDHCPIGLYFFQVFDRDTLFQDCRQRKITIPFENRVLTSSISPDGTDFKIESRQGYPAIIQKVYIPEDTLFVNEITLDIRFYFDGVYDVKMVSGSDNNTVFSECGYEFQEGLRKTLHLSNCPNQVNFDLTEENRDLKVYPNPFEDRIHIETSSVSVEKIVFTDAVGKEVGFTYNSSSQSLEFRHQLPAGLYILHLQMTDGGVHTFRFLRR